MRLTPEQSEQVESLLHESIRLRPDQRSDFLEGIRSSCEDAVFRELESLLAYSQEAHEFLEQSIVNETNSSPELSDPFVGRNIGRYRIVRSIGAGGMGVVYLAERSDAQFKKLVAIKLVHAGIVTGEIVTRFSTERQALANLEHPNIARLLDGGLTDCGLPYLVMEYVDGVVLDQHCDDLALSIVERLRLFRSVCDAVHSAHQNLIVHRDLKPSNILVSASGHVKLLDFGIAKILDPQHGAIEPTHTMTGHRAMTPRYASPEQICGEPVSTSTDVYSLGVVLFQLLTGRMPYDVPTTGTHPALEHQPMKPSALFVHNDEETTSVCASRGVDMRRLRRMLCGDLDTIVLKTLRKEPQRRYSSVHELSEDIARYLSGHPVRAQRDTMWYRTNRFIRRNWLPVFAASVMVVALVGGLIATTMMYFQMEEARQAEARQRRAAVEEAEAAQQVTTFLQEMLGSLDPEFALGRDVSVLENMLADAELRLKSDSASPRVAAALHSTIGHTYKGLGNYEQAEKHLIRAIELGRSQGKPNPRLLGYALCILGRTCVARGEYERAESLSREALDLVTGNDDPQLVADLQSNLGDLLRIRGDYSGARELLNSALTMNRSINGSNDRRVAQSLAGLGLLLQAEGRLTEAEDLLVEAVRIGRAVLPPNDPRLAIMLHNLGWVSIGTKKHGQAEASLSEALDIRRRVLPPDHPRIGVTMAALATTLSAQGKHREAADSYRDVLEFLERTLGARHTHVASTKNNLGTVLKALGEDQEAARLFREAADIFRESLDDEHPFAATALHNCASLVAKRDQGEALELFKEVVRLRRKRLPVDHPDLVTTIEAMADVLSKLDRDQEANDLFESELTRRRENLGERHPAVADLLRKFGEYMLEHGSAMDAELAFRQEIEIHQSSVPVDRVAVAMASCRLGRALSLQRRFPEAETTLLAAETVLAEIDSAELSFSHHALVDLYVAWKKMPDAEAWRAKSDNSSD